MTKKKVFKNSITYNKKSILYHNANYTLNLSTLYHTYNYRLQIPSLKNVAYSSDNLQFCFQNIINYENIIYVEQFNEEIYVLHVQPDIYQLIYMFDNTIPSKLSMFKEDKELKFNHLRSKIFEAFEKIDNFIEERNNFILNKNTENFVFEGMTKHASEEIKKIIYKINNTLPIQSIKYFDFFEEKSRLKKMNYTIQTNAFSDYKSIYNYFKNLINEKIEYFDGEEEINRLNRLEKQYKNFIENTINGDFYKKDLEQTKLAKTLTISDIDEINNSPLFNKENFALICLTLQDYLEKEQAIKEFINKIQTKTLQEYI